MKPSVSIIVPAYNEVRNVEKAIVSVLRAIEDAGITDYEIIAVNDGSTDGTGDAIYSIWGFTGLPIIGKNHPTNLGLRAAYETGLKHARHEYVTWVPGDGEMAQESITAILRAIGTADLVIPYHGTPWNRPWFRRLLTWGSTFQVNALLGHSLRYYQGPVVYPTKMARRLPRTESGFFFCAEMLAHALEEGLSYVQVPLVHQERQYGVSKAVSWRAIWRAQMLILRLAYRIHAQRMALVAEGMVLG